MYQFNKIFLLFFVFISKDIFSCFPMDNPHSYSCAKQTFLGKVDSPFLPEPITYQELQKNMIEDKLNALDGFWRPVTVNAPFSDGDFKIDFDNSLNMKTLFFEGNIFRPIGVLNNDRSLFNFVFVSTVRDERKNILVINMELKQFVERSRSIVLSLVPKSRPIGTDPFKNNSANKSGIDRAVFEGLTDRLDCIVFTRNNKRSLNPDQHLLCEWTTKTSWGEEQFRGYLGFVR